MSPLMATTDQSRGIALDLASLLWITCSIRKVCALNKPRNPILLFGMYKNQLQELAQRSCFNLPSYACTREGPDHAPRFKASVNFNGEIFEGPSYCTTLRQAEHAAAEVALNTLSTRGPSRSLAARVIDETGVHKNLLQETAHRAGLNLPVYSTMRSGPGHLPVFICIVELAGMNFAGESAKTKKQAEKNAAMAAWSALKQMTKPNSGSSQTNKETDSSEEQERVIVARFLSNIRPEVEKKPVRQRDQNQKRRMVIGYKDNSIGSSSSTHNSLQYPQWRFVNLLSDIPLVYQTQQQNQQQNSFSTLLPPTTSKILPQTSSGDHHHHPSMYRSRTQFNVQEIPPPLEEHQKDEEEWFNGKAQIRKKYTEKNTNIANSTSVFRSNLNITMPDHGAQKTPLRSRPFAPPRILVSGGVHRMAPAVHIRSVIPVCASPPMRSPSSPNPATPQMKESSISVSIQTEEEVSNASSKFNKLFL